MKHLVAIALLAASQSWAGSFAPTTEALTRNSACGALAVGMREDGTHIKGQAADRDGAQRVNAAGYWEFCAIPPLCRETVVLVWRDPRTKKTCHASRKTWPASHEAGRTVTLFAANERGSGDPTKGTVRGVCAPEGRWRVVDSVCRR